VTDSTPPDEDFEALMRRAARTRRFDAKIPHLEQAYRLADRLQDVDRGYEARTQLIDAANSAGQVDKALVAFSWCRAQFRKHPDRFDGSILLWENKWIIDVLTDLAEIPRKKINDALEDFVRFSREQGANPRSERKLRLMIARKLHDGGQRELLTRFLETPRDSNSDCVACDTDTHVDMLYRWGEFDAAFEAAQPILSGRQRCRIVPHITYPTLTLAALGRGQLEEARSLFLRGYPLVRNEKGRLDCVARHLQLLVRTGNAGTALSLVERHLPWALEIKIPADAVEFYAAARAALELPELASGETVPMKLPRSFPLYRRGAQPLTAQLRDWFETEALAIARKLDGRSGNQAREEWLHGSKEWPRQVQPIEITTGVG